MKSVGISRFNNNSALDAEIPLLDEVHELIVKEKQLLEFKIVEKAREAQEWKIKYDSLMAGMSGGDMTDITNKDGEVLRKLKVLQDAAEFDKRKDNSMKMVNESITIAEYIYKLGKDHFVLNMSNLPSDFVISKISYGSNCLKRYNSCLRAVYLKNCNLSDEHTDTLCILISNTATECIDLSFNNLGTKFESALIAILLVMTSH